MNWLCVNNRRKLLLSAFHFLQLDTRQTFLVSTSAINEFSQYLYVCKAPLFYYLFYILFSTLYFCPLFQSMDIINCSNLFMSIISHVLQWYFRVCVFAVCVHAQTLKVFKMKQTENERLFQVANIFTQLFHTFFYTFLLRKLFLLWRWWLLFASYECVCVVRLRFTQQIENRPRL